MTIEQLQEIAEENLDAVIDVINEYCSYNYSGDHIYRMDEFDEVFSGYTPLEIARDIRYGSSIFPGCNLDEDFNINEDYFYLDGYAHPVSFNTVCYQGVWLGFIDEDALLEYINENEIDF